MELSNTPCIAVGPALCVCLAQGLKGVSTVAVLADSFASGVTGSASEVATHILTSVYPVTHTSIHSPMLFTPLSNSAAYICMLYIFRNIKEQDTVSRGMTSVLCGENYIIHHTLKVSLGIW